MSNAYFTYNFADMLSSTLLTFLIHAVLEVMYTKCS